MRFQDISKVKNTMAKAINDDLMPRLSKLSLAETKEEFLKIVDDPTINIAKDTRLKYHGMIERQTTLMKAQMYICNIGLKSAGMGTF